MRKLLLLTAAIIGIIWHTAAQSEISPTLVIHGGAGTIERGSLTDSLEQLIRASLQQALDEGYSLLKKGGSATEAVEAAIMVLENSHHFNAGKGAVVTAEGRYELDASIMNGSDLNAGAVAGVGNVKNPIRAAVRVMHNSPHVLLVGEGAETFAEKEGLIPVEQSYFSTPAKPHKLQRHAIPRGDNHDAKKTFDKYGTAGAVAIDRDGNIAAGTSTGGIAGKQHGRIGDSPIIGAGTYADNSTCGVSCTGQGEYFMRIGLAKEVSDQMKFGRKSLQEAVQYSIHEHLSGMKGLGGLIAIDSNGIVVMEFNTPGMYRAYRNSEESKIDIYGE